jgi:hypothetical protein
VTGDFQRVKLEIRMQRMKREVVFYSVNFTLQNFYHLNGLIFTEFKLKWGGGEEGGKKLVSSRATLRNQAVVLNGSNTEIKYYSLWKAEDFSVENNK